MASIPLTQAKFLTEFQCLGGDCEDTCCKGWGMQLTQETVDKYKKDAPELLDAVTSGEAEHIMRRDEETDYCIKFDKGWCGIHAKYGTEFLGDACHFFPRVTRQLGDKTSMTASLSCPEVARLTLLAENGFAPIETETDRVPFSLKDYVTDDMPAEKAWELHQFFLHAVGDESITPERAVGRLRSLSESLSRLPKSSWPEAAAFYWKSADGIAVPSEPNPVDPFNLLNALQGLIGAARPSKRDRLMETIGDMEKALKVKLNWETLGIQLADDSAQASADMWAAWDASYAKHFAPFLHRWLQAQLSVGMFPFAGLAETMQEKVTLLGVRLATLKLALASACAVKGEAIDDAQAIRIVQSLARFLDHLADPTLSLQIYTETGWVKEARLRGLLAD